MARLVSAFILVLLSITFAVDAKFNCCTDSIILRHAAIGGSGFTRSIICKDGHLLPPGDFAEDKSCGKTVTCGYVTCECPDGCRTNNANNCDDEALKLFLQKDGKRLGITHAEIQYEKGTTPRPCGPQNHLNTWQQLTG